MLNNTRYFPKSRELAPARPGWAEGSSCSASRPRVGRQCLLGRSQQEPTVLAAEPAQVVDHGFLERDRPRHDEAIVTQTRIMVNRARRLRRGLGLSLMPRGPGAPATLEGASRFDSRLMLSVRASATSCAWGCRCCFGCCTCSDGPCSKAETARPLRVPRSNRHWHDRRLPKKLPGLSRASRHSIRGSRRREAWCRMAILAAWERPP